MSHEIFEPNDYNPKTEGIQSGKFSDQATKLKFYEMDLEQLIRNVVNWKTGEINPDIFLNVFDKMGEQYDGSRQLSRIHSDAQRRLAQIKNNFRKPSE